MKKAKKIFISLIILALCVVLGARLKASADATHNYKGWLWGGSNDGTPAPGPISTGLGWISMNNLDCDSDDDGLVDNLSCGVAGTPIAKYGVNIPAIDGVLSGYAWSSSLGWIDFAPAADMVRYPGCGFPPVAPAQCFPAKRTGNNLEGWARFSGIESELAKGNSGGWEGWISLKGTAVDGYTYGVEISKMDGKLTGEVGDAGPTYAWSNELGYIDFSGASTNVVLVNNLKICGGACSGGNLIDTSLDPAITKNYPIDTEIVLRACYNASFFCDNNSGDVTEDSNTNWSDNNSPNNPISFASKGRFNIDGPGKEGIAVTYDPDGTGPAVMIPKNFNVKINNVPIKNCWKCNSGTGNCASTPKAVCNVDEFEDDETGCNTVCNKSGVYIEVVP